MLRIVSAAAIVLLASTAAFAQSDTMGGTGPDTNVSAPSTGGVSPSTGGMTTTPNSDNASDSGTKKPGLEVEPPVSGKTEGGGLLLPWARVGVLAGVGFPAILDLALEARVKNMFSVGFGFMPEFAVPASITDVLQKADPNLKLKASLNSWNLRARWFPFMGSFFLGARPGKQNVMAEVGSTVPATVGPISKNVAVTVKGEADTLFLTPKLGWLATWDVGFTLGTEFGYQMAMSAETTSSISFGDSLSPAEQAAVKSAKDYSDMEKMAAQGVQALGEKGLPYWNILTLGWMF